MNTSCPACGQVIGLWELCRHRNPVGFCCCKDEHKDPTEPDDRDEAA